MHSVLWFLIPTDKPGATRHNGFRLPVATLEGKNGDPTGNL